MQLYLDTGNVDEIRWGVDTGVIDGVTTNPSLIAKEGRDLDEVIREIVGIFTEAGIDGFTVSAEVTALDVAGMTTEAEKLAAIDPHVVVKLPITEAGIAATSKLSKKGIRTNLTLCFNAAQALLAAKAGATFVSPFVGRLDDAGEDGMALIAEIRHIYDNYGLKTKILTASVRNEAHVVEAAKVGSDIATIPTKVFKSLYRHLLTDKGLQVFMDDWKRHQERAQPF